MNPLNPRKRDYARILIVESPDDKHSAIGLMKARVHWPDRPAQDWPVWVEVGNSVDEILAPRYLTGEIKAPHVTTVGVLLDADDSAAGRYQRIRQLAEPLFPNLPPGLPKEGLIAENLEGKRFGLWVMPDNESAGDLETFLRHTVPPEKEGLWQRASTCVENALEAGAECRETHLPKARLYTWLAWQDPPGQSPGRALTRRVLDPRSEHAEAFIAWFMNLFQLEARTSTV